MKQSKLLLGSHMSIAGSIEHSLYKGAALGCTCIQIFTHNNRRWGYSLFSDQECLLFEKAQKETKINHVIAHASYLINLASKSSETVEKSMLALEHELMRCDQLGISYLVLHPGAGLTPAKEAIKQVAININKLFEKNTTKATILLETMAGQGTCIGSTFEQLAAIYQAIENKNRIGICLDTCHIWAAGYDISTAESYAKTLNLFDSQIGLNTIKAIHLNNSQKAFASCVDRHAHIDKGTLALEAFSYILNDKLFFDVPKIIETPKDSQEDDVRNLSILKSLLKPETKKLLHIVDSNS